MDEHGNLLACSYGWEAYMADFTAVLDKVSGTDAGFVNTVTGGDTDPFNSGEKVSFTVSAGAGSAWSGKIWGVADPDEINGISAADIGGVLGVS